MNPNNHNRQSGASQLLLVLIVAFILTLIISSIQVLTFISAKLAAQSVYSQQAYFAAEGALFESLNHAKADPDWPAQYPYTDTYTINDTIITRTITQNPDGSITIETQSDAKGAARKFRASLTRGSDGNEDIGPLDIMIVIDNSGSMHRVSGTSGLRAYQNAQIAATKFIEILDTQTSDTRIGLVRFQDPIFLDTAYQLHPLTALSEKIFGFPTPREELNAVIDTFVVADSEPGTWLTPGIEAAVNHLHANGRLDAQKILIILSDGVATGYWGNSTQTQEKWCVPVYCYPESNYSPSQHGTTCTQTAIDTVTTAKNNQELLVFSILFKNIPSSSCNSNQLPQLELGRQTNFLLSSEPPGIPIPGTDYTFYKETDSADELPNIFEDLAGEITEGTFFKFSYQEIEPEPVGSN